jgi:hypothetical protein
MLNGNHSAAPILNGCHSALVILAPPNTSGTSTELHCFLSCTLSSPAPHITATVNMPPKASAKRKAPASVAAPLPDEPKFKRGTRNSAAEQIEIDSDLEDMDGSQSTAPLSSLQAPSLSPPSMTNDSTEAGYSQSSVSVYTTPTRSSPPKTQKASIPPPAFSATNSGSHQLPPGTVGSSDFWHPDFPADLLEAKNSNHGAPRLNIRGVLNFHLKVLMIRQRNISTSDRREMVNVAVSIFGLE